MKMHNQKLPLRIHRAGDHMVVAAPMPGLSPNEINITVMDRTVLLHGEKRGSGRADRDFILNEWAVGPYLREMTLPEKVRGDLANATYGNGVLVLSLPIADKAQDAVRGSFQLRPVTATRGERVGHVGREIRPTSTANHQKKHR